MERERRIFNIAMCLEKEIAGLFDHRLLAS
jgi:hypothetical protein